MSGTYTRPEYDLNFEEVPEGVRVTQHGSTYIARKWRLTPEVLKVIDSALSHGLTALWQHGHPKGETSHHLSFSFDHSPASWVLAIGAPSGPPKLRCVTMNKKYKEYFKASGLGYYWQFENSGGQNIEIRPEDLTSILTILPMEEIRQGKLPVLTPRSRATERSPQYYRNEADLENELFRRILLSSRTPMELQRQRSFPSNQPIEPLSRPDILILEPDLALVLELKLHSVGEVEFSQLMRYLNNKFLQWSFAPRTLHGVLVGDRFSQSALSAAALTDQISLAQYGQNPNGSLFLRTVSGKDYLSRYFDL
jgi:hypothetical protein